MNARIIAPMPVRIVHSAVNINQVHKPVGIEIIPKAPTAVVSNIVRTAVGNAIVAVCTAVCNAIVAVVVFMAVVVNIAQRKYNKGTPSTIMQTLANAKYSTGIATKNMAVPKADRSSAIRYPHASTKHSAKKKECISSAIKYPPASTKYSTRLTQTKCNKGLDNTESDVYSRPQVNQA